MFLATAICWIAFSNQIAFALQPEHHRLVQTFSRLAFAFFAAGLLHWRLKRAEVSVARAADGASPGDVLLTGREADKPQGAAWRLPQPASFAEQAPWAFRLHQRDGAFAVSTTAQDNLPPGMAAAVSRRVAVEAGLLLASLDDEFSLQLQPKWCVRTRRTVGAEALLRWNCPGLGAVSPEEFIPIAEQHPVIMDLGRWTVVQVVRALAARHRRHGALQVSINLAARQLQDEGFPRFVAARLSEAGLPSSCIQFELTETGLIRNVDAARDFLMALRNNGLSVALDDFGAGYSSLSYLARFPVDVIKLERSFVEHLPHDPASCVVASGVIAMAAQLEVMTVAEGVETEAQRQFLEDVGCAQAQGWLVCGALSVDEFFRRQEKHAACAFA
jgi:EAL domain-containing protein (putative c-di-GMP-specific phosphodiesterase class I)